MAPHLIKPNCGLKQVIKSLWKAFYKTFALLGLLRCNLSRNPRSCSDHRALQLHTRWLWWQKWPIANWLWGKKAHCVWKLYLGPIKRSRFSYRWDRCGLDFMTLSEIQGKDLLKAGSIYLLLRSVVFRLYGNTSNLGKQTYFYFRIHLKHELPKFVSQRRVNWESIFREKDASSPKQVTDQICHSVSQKLTWTTKPIQL